LNEALKGLEPVEIVWNVSRKDITSH